MQCLTLYNIKIKSELKFKLCTCLLSERHCSINWRYSFWHSVKYVANASLSFIHFSCSQLNKIITSFIYLSMYLSIHHICIHSSIYPSIHLFVYYHSCLWIWFNAFNCSLSERTFSSVSAASDLPNNTKITWSPRDQPLTRLFHCSVAVSFFRFFQNLLEIFCLFQKSWSLEKITYITILWELLHFLKPFEK